jgi:hypothetical protein
MNCKYPNESRKILMSPPGSSNCVHPYLFRREVQELVEIDTAVRELAESSALLRSLVLVSL